MLELEKKIIWFILVLILRTLDNFFENFSTVLIVKRHTSQKGCLICNWKCKEEPVFPRYPSASMYLKIKEQEVKNYSKHCRNIMSIFTGLSN